VFQPIQTWLSNSPRQQLYFGCGSGSGGGQRTRQAGLADVLAINGMPFDEARSRRHFDANPVAFLSVLTSFSSSYRF
jgi:hypothetical protein